MLGILPALAQVTLCNSGDADAFAPHLSALAADGTAVTRLVLEQRGALRGGPSLRPVPAVPFPPRLQSLDLVSDNSLGQPLISSLTTLLYLTQLKLSPVSRSELQVVPWTAFSRLQRLELRLALEEPSPQPDGATGVGAQAPEAALGMAADWTGMVLDLIARLPALSHLRVQDLPNPADDPRIAQLLRCSASAAALAPAAARAPAGAVAQQAVKLPKAAAPPVTPPEDGRAAAAGAFTALRHLDLDFLDADDECDYVRCARVTFGARRGGDWRDPASGGSGAGWAGGCVGSGGADGGGRDGGGLQGVGVALGVRVMAVANDSVQDSDSEGDGGSSSSSSGDGATPGSCGSGISIRRSSVRGRGRNSSACRSAGNGDEGKGEPTGGGERRKGGGGNGDVDYRGKAAAGNLAANDVTDDVITAVGDLLRGLRLTGVATNCGADSPTSAALAGLGLTSCTDFTGDGRSPETNAASASDPPDDFARDGRSVTGIFEGPSVASPGRTQGSQDASARCTASAAASAHVPAPEPAEASPGLAPAVAVTSLELVLCCDAAAGACCGAQTLHLDLSGLPALAALGLRLFSDTATTSYSQGCELRLRGAAALTSLRLLRSDGAAPPPELGGGLVAALAREAPRLRGLVAEGAVLTAARAVGAEGGGAAAGAAIASTAADLGDGEVSAAAPAHGGLVGLAALADCRQLEHLALRLMPYCGPPRYSRAVSAAWLPLSLMRLELANAELSTASATATAAVAPSAAAAVAAAEPAGSLEAVLYSPDRPFLSEAAQRYGQQQQQQQQLLPHLAHLALQGCHAADLLSLSRSTDLTHLQLNDCVAPGLTAAAAAATWPSMRKLSVSASHPGAHGPQLGQSLRRGRQQRGGGDASATRMAEAEAAAAAAAVSAAAREPWALTPEDVDALAAVTGLRSLSWHAPHGTAGVGPSTLERLSCLSGLTRLSLHLGYDNHVTPEQLLRCLGRMSDLVEVDVAVGYGPCRACVGGEAGEGAAVARGGGGGWRGGDAAGPSSHGSLHPGSLGDWLAEALPHALVAVRRG